jgi:XTP/dITP diphosphohydrolase
MSAILIATHNRGKLIEIQSLLDALEARLLSPDDIGLQLKIEEDGQTYAENAARKAIAYAKAGGLLTLADDSGLEVQALNGLPGLHSARFSPLPNASDADRRAYLLKQLQGHPRPWKARFRCIVAMVDPRAIENINTEQLYENMHYTEGICEGEIIPQERGQNGFGYDPIFLIPELGRTMAQLTLQEKNEVSHRARAVRAARPILTKLLGVHP